MYINSSADRTLSQAIRHDFTSSRSNLRRAHRLVIALVLQLMFHLVQRMYPMMEAKQTRRGRRFCSVSPKEIRHGLSQ